MELDFWVWRWDCTHMDNVTSYFLHLKFNSKLQIGPITNIMKVYESYGILIFGAIIDQLAVQTLLVLANDKFLS
jgi:hypothetical protein